MNVTALLSLSLILFYLSTQQCYAGEAEFLREFLKARENRFHTTSVNQGLAAAYEKPRPVSELIVPQEGSKEDDMISALPGQPCDANFAQYSGFVTVDAKAGRALFYYFTESTQDPSNKPLVLWLNGGPGCSSMGAGAMTELGSFRVHRNGLTLRINPYAWNNVANILFLESPAGVGFSYSNTLSDYVTGDENTRKDTFTFLINWLGRFPEYKNRDFYITGESYAGHYAPQLAQLILSHKKEEPNLAIKLKGIAFGNALIDGETTSIGRIDYFRAHALISDEIYGGIFRHCNFSAETTSDACDYYRDQVSSCVESLDPYNIYAPLCNPKANTSLPSECGFDPCSDNYANSYLNTAEVQKALHVRQIPYSWGPCNFEVNTKWKDSPKTILPIIQELMQSGIRIWIYSGDTDGVLPVTTTQYAINKMKLAVKTAWYPWYVSDDEVGGFAEEYQNLTFVTIRGSGHFVPSNQPARALIMFSSFINGTLPPN